MCTSLSVKLSNKASSHLLFGRNMDIEAHFGEQVVATPRHAPLRFRCLPTIFRHFAIIGTAVVKDGYPLYADAMNQKGLCMAGLHFPGNAVYAPPCGFADESNALAPFELIPYLLGTCATIAEVRSALGKVRLSGIHFSHDLPNTPLHWHVAARDGGLILESTAQGLMIYEDSCGVLTNNPPYPYQIAHLHRYDGLTAHSPTMCHRKQNTPVGETYDLGLGLLGLPGDYTSPARFVRCATLLRIVDWAQSSPSASISQFFRVLGAVAPPAGCVKTPTGAVHTTRYTCCMDTETLTYHMITDEDVRLQSYQLPQGIAEKSDLQFFSSPLQKSKDYDII